MPTMKCLVQKTAANSPKQNNSPEIIFPPSMLKGFSFLNAQWEKLKVGITTTARGQKGVILKRKQSILIKRREGMETVASTEKKIMSGGMEWPLGMIWWQ